MRLIFRACADRGPGLFGIAKRSRPLAIGRYGQVRGQPCAERTSRTASSFSSSAVQGTSVVRDRRRYRSAVAKRETAELLKDRDLDRFCRSATIAHQSSVSQQTRVQRVLRAAIIAVTVRSGRRMRQRKREAGVVPAWSEADRASRIRKDLRVQQANQAHTDLTCRDRGKIGGSRRTFLAVPNGGLSDAIRRRPERDAWRRS